MGNYERKTPLRSVRPSESIRPPASHRSEAPPVDAVGQLRDALRRLLQGPRIQLPPELVLPENGMLTYPGYFQFIGGNAILLHIAELGIVFACGRTNFSQLTNMQGTKIALAGGWTIPGIDEYVARRSPSLEYQEITLQHLMTRSPSYFSTHAPFELSRSEKTFISAQPAILLPLSDEAQKEIFSVNTHTVNIRGQIDSLRVESGKVKEVGISNDAFLNLEENQRRALIDVFHETLRSLTQAPGISESTSALLRTQIESLLAMLQKTSSSGKSRIEIPSDCHDQKRKLIDALNNRTAVLAQLEGLKGESKVRASVPRDALKNDTPEELRSLVTYLTGDVAALFFKSFHANRMSRDTLALIQNELTPFILMVLQAMEKTT